MSLLFTTLLFTGFAVYLYIQRRHVSPITYIPSIHEEGEVLGESADTRPFASKNGKTYTFSWCSGSGQIKQANKIYFANEEAAAASGRALSKLCTR